MSAYSAIKRTGTTILRTFPPLRAMQERAYEEHFTSDKGFGLYRGVFRTFEEAADSAPTSKPLGWDTPDYARMFDERHAQIYPYDYPVLFWLRPLLVPGVCIFDYGGHVGLQFYSYRKYLAYPERLTWTVFDVPETVDRGRALAAERGVSEQLPFTIDEYDASGAHILIAAGVLQFVNEPTFDAFLRGLRRPPKHLLLNKLPLSRISSFYTLQNAGPTFAAMRIFDRAELLAALSACGYEVVDEWHDHMHSCVIPFHPERAVTHYSGLYLRLR